VKGWKFIRQKFLSLHATKSFAEAHRRQHIIALDLEGGSGLPSLAAGIG
jgi:hypothetical protein